MKLSMHSPAGLMSIARIEAQDGRLVITALISGAVPIRAVLTAAELKSVLKMLGVRKILSIAWVALAR